MIALLNIYGSNGKPKEKKYAIKKIQIAYGVPFGNLALGCCFNFYFTYLYGID
jgi:hypothetical protein